jgi:hypothetical protein
MLNFSSDSESFFRLFQVILDFQHPLKMAALVPTAVNKSGFTMFKKTIICFVLVLCFQFYIFGVQAWLIVLICSVYFQYKASFDMFKKFNPKQVIVRFCKLLFKLSNTAILVQMKRFEN